MKIVKPNVTLIWITPNAEQVIEKAGRTCYKSKSEITSNNTKKFIKMIIEKGHDSVLEHGVVSLRFICDRGVSHEIVRHRMGSYSQESTRYVNYKNGLEIIKPCFWNSDFCGYDFWLDAMTFSELQYKNLIKSGATPQEARSVLPNSLKTELVMTANFREWRHVLKLRLSKQAHPQIREIMYLALKILYKNSPTVFGDIYEKFTENK